MKLLFCSFIILIPKKMSVKIPHVKKTIETPNKLETHFWLVLDTGTAKPIGFG